MKFLECIELNPKINMIKGQDYPFIEMTNISTCYRSPNKVEIKAFDSGVRFQDGDTVVARITPCLQNGKRFYCQDIGTGFGSTEYLVFRPINNSIDNKYLYYFMQTDFIKQSMINSMTGATGRQRVNNDVFNNIEASFPEIDIQKKIGEILSAYDDLIENNRKQIKLLEEVAQRLYKEWFVDLRFPGWETTPVINGVPVGWTEGTLANLVQFRRGKTITKKQVKEGNIPVIAGGLEPAYYHDTSNTTAPVITVSGTGANAGFARMYHTKVWASDCSYVDSSTTLDIVWLYCFLKENQTIIISMQKGVAQPHVYAKDINAMKTIVPNNSMLRQFRMVTQPMFTQISKLEMQIELLTEARDRLLPKLMNDELEV